MADEHAYFDETFSVARDSQGFWGTWEHDPALKDVRAHCYCTSLVRTLVIGHARATSSFTPIRKLNKT